jgi:serine O-acetyltransferase
MSEAPPPLNLEAIVDAVAESYTQGREIDSLETAALPSRRKIIEALLHLEHAAFLGYYTTRNLKEDNLRHYLAEHLYSASALLCEQIARAVVYERRGGPAPQAVDVAWSERVVHAVFAQIPQIRAQLSWDINAAYQGDPSAHSIEEIVFSYPAVQAITAYRFAHEFQQRGVPLIPRIISEHAHNLTGIDINPSAVIGKRFFIDHGTGVVIGETALIGDDVKLYQGVTLGAISVPRDADGVLIRETKRHPTIEDNVTIYAGATILGGKTVIGHGSIIGANTWITESVPPNTRVTYSAYQAHATQRVEPARATKPPAG